ncbi:MAG: glycosyltransferase family 1 protein, partial [Candidatus Jorgensenbacteria bacterium]|nr:glycosyltransferase family 1 protein [Candidatus Jorgensenbacteria bacterium]
MRILIDVRPLLSGVSTGVEEYTKEIVSKLLTLGAKHRYTLFWNGLRAGKLPRPWRELPRVNWRIPNKLLDLSFHYLNFPKVDRFVRTDLIFSPHFNLLRMSPTVRRVITFHDLSFVRFPKFFSPRKRLWHAMQDIRTQARTASRLIAVSEFTKTDLVHYFGIPPEQIAVIHSGVNRRYRELPPRDFSLLRFRAVKNLVHPFILAVGTLEPRKNLVGAIRAFNILKERSVHRDLEFVMVGRLGWLYDEVLKEVRASPYRKYLRLWGAATANEILMLYNSADVFCYPSFLEGFGFPVLEAQACGCPVVASTGGSLPEVLEESALLVGPEQHEALAEALHAVLTDEGEAARLKAAGFVNVGRFSWERAARETLAWLEKK